MAYYYLAQTDNWSEIGDFPQSQQTNPRGMHLEDYGHYTSIPDDVPLPKLKLTKKAKPTDVISTVAINPTRLLPCRKRFIEVISNFDIPPFTSKPLEVFKGKSKIQGYHLFHINHPSDQQFVVFKECEYRFGKLGDWRFEGDQVDIQDLKDYEITRRALLRKGYTLKTKKTVIDLKHADKDMYRLSIITRGRGHLVSEGLKEALEAEGLTGFKCVSPEEYEQGLEVRMNPPF